MKPEIWKKILNEMSENNLPSLQMDHEAESMMNPKFFDMLKDATEKGVFDMASYKWTNVKRKKFKKTY